MLDIILLSLIIGLFNCGLFLSQEKGQLLDPLSRWLFRNIGKKAHKPIFGCTTCMASVWGTAIFALQYFTVGWVDWWWLPVVVVMGAFVGTWLITQIPE